MIWTIEEIINQVKANGEMNAQVLGDLNSQPEYSIKAKISLLASCIERNDLSLELIVEKLGEKNNGNN